MQMRSFFSPAIALMNRLGYTKKFALLWLISLTAVIVIFFALFIILNKEISTSQRELQGVALISPISHAVQVIQQHRGFSTLLLDGNEALRNEHDAKGKEAAQAFAAMEERLPPT